MKKILILLFLLMACGNAASIDASRACLELEIIEVEPQGILNVNLSNANDKKIKVWKDSNSWGFARWRVIRIREGKSEVYYQNPERVFTRNIPSYNFVERDKSIKIRLDLNDGEWCKQENSCESSEEKISRFDRVEFKSSDFLIIIFDIPRTTEALTLDVWYGVVAASWSGVPNQNL